MFLGGLGLLLLPTFGVLLQSCLPALKFQSSAGLLVGELKLGLGFTGSVFLNTSEISYTLILPQDAIKQIIMGNMRCKGRLLILERISATPLYSGLYP